jgi:hypothetical protein
MALAPKTEPTTIPTRPAAPTAIPTVRCGLQLFFPGALASIAWSPESTGIAVSQLPSPKSFPSHFTSIPGKRAAGAGEMITFESTGSIALARSAAACCRAVSSRFPPRIPACCYAPHALAVRGGVASR